MLCLGALLIGMSKTGLSGIGLMVVPLLASTFGGRPSVGLLLPILVFADFFAVIWYNRHAMWHHILRLLPWAMAGIAAGTLVGSSLTETSFNRLLAVIIITGVAILVWQDLKKNVKIPHSRWFAAGLGLLGGFATMIGNAAGPVMSFYMLSMRLPKNTFIGTGAWFFLIINISKVPLHIWVWKTIDSSSILLDVLMIPVIATGAFLGIWLVRLFPEKIYRLFIILSTLLSALLLI
jgi:uncharacterized protein